MTAEGFAGFLNAIPSAAASPLALIAYVVAVAAWTAIAWRVRRFSVLMRDIEKFPRDERRQVVEVELGYVHIPQGITGEQYLRRRIHTYLFSAFIALCVVVVIVIGMSFYRYYERRAVSDNMINEILGPSARSEFMSAVNVLANGRTMVVEAAAEIKQPPLSFDEVGDITDKLHRQHLSAEQIVNRLADYAGTRRLQKTNKLLLQAINTVDNEFSNLARCYRSANCGNGTQFERLCDMVNRIQKYIDRINYAAQHISGVHFNESGTEAMLSNGALDIYFVAVKSNSIYYLAHNVCNI